MKMKYCSYCGSLLDETTGVCPKCYGGMDAPKQEEQVSELTSVPKVDLGDSPFATAPSTVIPTLTLDPFGNSAAQGSGPQVQLEFGNASETTQASASGPQLVMPETQTPSPVQTGSGITLELKPGVSVEPEKPVELALEYRISWPKDKRLEERRKAMKVKTRFCPGCGSIVTGKFCPECGKEV